MKNQFNLHSFNSTSQRELTGLLTRNERTYFLNCCKDETNTDIQLFRVGKSIWEMHILGKTIKFNWGKSSCRKISN